MTAVQLSIFDELDEIQDERPIATCPHCLYSWRIRPSEMDTWLARHEEPEGPWADVLGGCANQRIHVWRVQIRARHDLTKHWVPYKDARPTETQGGGHELLWAILGAKERGCTDELIQQAIDEARDEWSRK